MAEIGDPRRFHSAKALIAYAGIRCSTISILVSLLAQSVICPSVAHE